MVNSFTRRAFSTFNSDDFLTPGVFIKTLGSTIYFTLFIMVLCLTRWLPRGLFSGHASAIIQMANVTVSSCNGTVLDQLPHPGGGLVADARPKGSDQSVFALDWGHRQTTWVFCFIQNSATQLPSSSSMWCSVSGQYFSRLPKLTEPFLMPQKIWVPVHFRYSVRLSGPCRCQELQSA